MPQCGQQRRRESVVGELVVQGGPAPAHLGKPCLVQVQGALADVADTGAPPRVEQVSAQRVPHLIVQPPGQRQDEVVPAGQVSETRSSDPGCPTARRAGPVLAQVPARLKRPRHRQPQPRETQQLPEQRDIAARLSTTRPSQEAPRRGWPVDTPASAGSASRAKSGTVAAEPGAGTNRLETGCAEYMPRSSLEIRTTQVRQV